MNVINNIGITLQDYFNSEEKFNVFHELYEYQKKETGDVSAHINSKSIIELKSFGECFLFFKKDKSSIEIYIKTCYGKYFDTFTCVNLSYYKYLIAKYNEFKGWKKTEKVDKVDIDDKEKKIEKKYTVKSNIINIDEKLIKPIHDKIKETKQDIHKSPKEEEQDNANENRQFLIEELEFSKSICPNPNYTSPLGSMHLKTQSHLNRLIKSGSFYEGHLLINDVIKGTEYHYYFMDNDEEKYSIFKNQKDVRFVNVRDDFKIKGLRVQDLVNIWRGYINNSESVFSRNIDIENWNVNSVSEVFDKRVKNKTGVDDDRITNLELGIIDTYLRDALLKNKGKKGIETIIQSIQEKQNTIRTLSSTKQLLVQGCAGSGKTVVLLHRLGFLLYNKYLSNDLYFLLVPGLENKNFIKNMATRQGVDEERVKTYTEYYKYLVKESVNAVKEHDESDLLAAYLKRVYSEQFIKDSYSNLLNMISSYADKAIETCIESVKKLNEQKELELNDLKNQELKTYNKEVQKAINKLYPALSIKYNKKFKTLCKIYEEIEVVINKLTLDLDAEINKIKVSNQEIENVLESDFVLKELKKDIEDLKRRIGNGSFISNIAQRRKLNVLIDIYNDYVEKYKIKIQEDKKEELANKIRSNCNLVKGVSVDALKEAKEIVLSIINKVEESTAQKQEELKQEQEKTDLKFSPFLDKIKTSIKNLKDFIIKENTYSVVNLKPLDKGIGEKINEVKLTINDFKQVVPSSVFNIKNINRLFCCQDIDEIITVIHTNMIESYRRILKEEFNIRLSNYYKHYWFLIAYCDYLIYNDRIQKLKMLFIDEAQDLSCAEIKFIKKINASALINLFGDINQNITSYGVKNWNDLGLVSEYYLLDENFRNTNQIIEYNNRVLPSEFHMKQVAVDMDKVSEYDRINRVISKLEGATCIVKNADMAKKLTAKLKKLNISIFNVYTIKQVKGIEFKETFVFDQGMTENEKYIAYTRALVKLNVVKSF